MAKSPLLKMLVENVLKLDNDFDIVSELSKLVCDPTANKNLCVHGAQVLEKDRSATQDTCDHSGGSYQTGKTGVALATVIRQECICPDQYIRDPGGNSRCVVLSYTNPLIEQYGTLKLVYVECPFQCLAYNPDAANPVSTPIDIVLLVDSTGSMQTQKSNVENLIVKFMAVVANVAGSIPPSYTIVEFGNQLSDYPYAPGVGWATGAGRYPVIHSTVYTVDDLVRDYETIDFRLGDGQLPSGLEAILAACTIPFRQNSIRKFIYLSDASLSRGGDTFTWQSRRNNTISTLDEYDIITALVNLRVNLIVADNPADKWASMVARMTGGKIYGLGDDFWDSDLDVLWSGIPINEPLPTCPPNYQQPYPKMQYEYMAINNTGCGNPCPNGWSLSNGQCVRAVNTAQVQYCNPVVARRCDDNQSCCVWPSSNGYLPLVAGGTFYVIFNIPKDDTYHVKAAIKDSGNFYIDEILIASCNYQWTYVDVDLTEGLHQAKITCSWTEGGGDFSVDSGYVAIQIMDDGANNVWTTCDGTVVPQGCPSGYWFDDSTHQCAAYKSILPCTLEVVADSLDSWESLYIFHGGNSTQMYITEDPYKINTFEIWAKSNTLENTWTNGSRGHDISFKILFNDLHNNAFYDLVQGTTSTNIYYQKATRYVGIPTPHFRDLITLDAGDTITCRPEILSFTVEASDVPVSSISATGPWSTNWTFKWKTSCATRWFLWIEVNSDQCYKQEIISSLDLYPLPPLGSPATDIKWYPPTQIPQSDTGTYVWYPGNQEWEQKSVNAVLEIIDDTNGLTAARKIDIYFDFGCICPDNTTTIINGECHIYDVQDPLLIANVSNYVPIDVPFNDIAIWVSNDGVSPIYDMNKTFILALEVYVDYETSYTFGSMCTDGCDIWLDENLLMTNYEIHGWRMVKQDVTYGWHTFTIVTSNVSHTQEGWAYSPSYVSLEMKTIDGKIYWATGSLMKVVRSQCMLKHRSTVIDGKTKCLLSSIEYCLSTQNCNRFVNGKENQANGFTLVEAGLINELTQRPSQTLFLWNKRASASDIEGLLFYTNNGWYRFTNDDYLAANPDIQRLIAIGRWPNGSPVTFATPFQKGREFIKLCPYSFVVPVINSSWPTELAKTAVWVSADGNTVYEVDSPNSVTFQSVFNIDAAGTFIIEAGADSYATYSVDGTLLITITDASQWVGQSFYLATGQHTLTIVAQGSGSGSSYSACIGFKFKRPQQVKRQNRKDWVRYNHWIIVARKNIDYDDFETYLMNAGIKILRDYLQLDHYLVEGTELQIDKIRNDNRIINVVHNHIIRITKCNSETVNLSTTNWGLYAIAQLTLTDYPNVPSDQLYTWSKGGLNVDIISLDTGVNLNHEEFSNRTTSVIYDVQADNTIQNPPSFYTSITSSDEKYGSDCCGHGTHVAGIAMGNLYGVAKTANLRVAKIFIKDTTNDSEYCELSWVLHALDTISSWHQDKYNNGNNVPTVINASIGASSSTLLTAFQNVIDAGVVLSAAAGNSGVDLNTEIDYAPANVSDALTVGALDISTNKFSIASFSNYGSMVDVFAPGTNILSADYSNINGSILMSGTSMATPFVTGVLAQWLEGRQIANSSTEAQSANVFIVNQAALTNKFSLPEKMTDTNNNFLITPYTCGSPIPTTEPPITTSAPPITTQPPTAPPETTAPPNVDPLSPTIGTLFTSRSRGVLTLPECASVPYTGADYFIDFGAYENTRDDMPNACMIRTSNPPDQLTEECFRYIDGDENKLYRWTLVPDFSVNNDILNPPNQPASAICPYSQVISVTCPKTVTCWPPWCQELLDNGIWVSADGVTATTVISPNTVTFGCTMKLTNDGRYYLYGTANGVATFNINTALVMTTNDSTVWFSQDIYLQAGYYTLTIMVENSGLSNNVFSEDIEGMAFIFTDNANNVLYSSRTSTITLPACSSTPLLPTYRLHWNNVLATPDQVIGATFFTSLGWCIFTPQNYKLINNLSATTDTDLANLFINQGAYASMVLSANHCISNIKVISPNSCAIFSDNTYQFRMHYDGPALTDVYTKTGTEIVAPYPIVDGALILTSMGLLTFSIQKYILANPDVNMLVQTGLAEPMPGDYAKYTYEDAVGHLNRTGAWDSNWGRCLDCPDIDLTNLGCYLDGVVNHSNGWSFQPNPNGYGMSLCYKGIVASSDLVEGALFWTTRGQYEIFTSAEYMAINPDVRLCVKRGYTYIGFPLPLPSKDMTTACNPTFATVTDPTNVNLPAAPSPGATLAFSPTATPEPTPKAKQAYNAANHFIDIGAYQGRFNRGFNRATGRNSDFSIPNTEVVTPTPPPTVTPQPTAAPTKSPKPTAWPDVTPMPTITPPPLILDPIITVAPSNLPPPQSFSDVSCGQRSMAAISFGQLWTWGNNDYGELGLSTSTNTLAPVLVGTNNTWLSVDHGFAYVAALRNDGSLWTWGNNTYGQLGQGDTTARTTGPVRVGKGTNWTQIACSYYSMFALRDGGLWAWGNNIYGQLGLMMDDGKAVDDLSNKLVPTRVGTDSSWVFISAGSYFSAGIKADGSLWTWGVNDHGQLGVGNTNNISIPTLVNEYNTWSYVSCGNSIMMAITTSGRLWVCGRNDRGQLGLGHTNPVYSLTLMDDVTSWIQVSCNKGGNTKQFFTLAQQKDGTLWAWGDNDYGQLGLGDTTSRMEPSSLKTTWNIVKAGADTSAAIKYESSLWVWGNNSNGELGLGDILSRWTPNLSA